jgi:hypothetical protein
MLNPEEIDAFGLSFDSRPGSQDFLDEFLLHNYDQFQDQYNYGIADEDYHGIADEDDDVWWSGANFPRDSR